MENQTKGYLNIQHIESTMSHYHVHHNAGCIKCKALHLEMVRVGAVIFCEDCVRQEFSSKDPVREEREIYLKWLHRKYKRGKNGQQFI